MYYNIIVVIIIKDGCGAVVDYCLWYWTEPNQSQRRSVRRVKLEFR